MQYNAASYTLQHMFASMTWHWHIECIPTHTSDICFTIYDDSVTELGRLYWFIARKQSLAIALF